MAIRGEMGWVLDPRVSSSHAFMERVQKYIPWGVLRIDTSEVTDGDY